MCGINAVADFTGSSGGLVHEAVQRMNDTIAHRGPDGEGIFSAKNGAAILGSRRLAIVDVEGGTMPIRATVDDREYAIVCNGEFFNYRELRGDLEKKYDFKTRSDTEVALFAYIEWGESCVEKLRGQFAFVIYDGSRERLFLARDRFGIKPMYYALAGSKLIVSSEPKGILAEGTIAPEPDRRAIASLFLSVFSIMGKSEPVDRSCFAGISALPAGSYATFDGSGLSPSSYSQIRPHHETADSSRDWAGEMRKTMEHAIASQVPDEVPYIIPLSGGLDSSIILVESLKSNTPPFAAASVRYANVENPDYEHARLLAGEQGVELIAPPISSEEILRDIDRFVRALDRPSDSTRNLGLFALYENAQTAGAKVAIIGEGSDEFNLGYYYRLPGFLNAGDECAHPEGFRKLLKSRIKAVARYFRPEFIDETMLERIVDDSVSYYFEETHFEDPLERMEYLYIREFLKGRLDMHDRCAMAHGIEARVPFCDEDAAALALSVPAVKNLVNGTEKAILREAFRDELPREIAERRKSPLPEDQGPLALRALLEAFDRAFSAADDSVWESLDRGFAVELRGQAERAAEAIERGTKVALGDGAKLNAPVDFRSRHLFLLLTLLRWYDIYFVKMVTT